MKLLLGLALLSALATTTLVLGHACPRCVCNCANSDNNNNNKYLDLPAGSKCGPQDPTDEAFNRALNAVKAQILAQYPGKFLTQFVKVIAHTTKRCFFESVTSQGYQFDFTIAKTKCLKSEAETDQQCDDMTPNYYTCSAVIVDRDEAGPNRLFFNPKQCHMNFMLA